MSVLPTIGVTCDPFDGIRHQPVSFRHPFKLWRKAVWYKANPRAAEDMQRRFSAAYPQGRLLDVTSGDAALRECAGAGTVVLVYPDSIGLGFLLLEQKLARMAPHAEVVVLNGRGRSFVFDARGRRALRLRRVLEWIMLVELVAGAAIVVATPVLLLVDLVRGRR